MSAQLPAKYQAAIGMTLIHALENLGYRIVGPDEWDDHTLERAAEVVEKMPWHKPLSPDHVAANKPEDFAAAIRAMKNGGNR